MAHGFITADDLRRAMSALPQEGKKAELLAGGWDGRYAIAVLGIAGVRPDAEIHEHAADVITVLEGSAIVTLGGRLTDERITGPGERKGPSIEGGEARTVAPGDALSIPRGMPHQFDARGGSVVFLIVKVNDVEA